MKIFNNKIGYNDRKENRKFVFLHTIFYIYTCKQPFFIPFNFKKMEGMHHINNFVSRGGEYAAPTLEALEIRCEQGFAVSVETGMGGSTGFDNTPGQWNE